MWPGFWIRGGCSPPGLGKAVLLSTYGHPKTLAMASRIIYIGDGRLVEPPVEPKRPADQAEPASAGTPIRHIAARRDDRVLLFAPPDIHYAFAQETAVYIQADGGSYAVTFTLAELEERLSDQGFFRCRLSPFCGEPNRALPEWGRGDELHD